VIAQAIGCSPQAVRNVLRAFERRGLAVVAMQSRRPHAAAKVFDAQRSERLKALLRPAGMSRPVQSSRRGVARSAWPMTSTNAVTRRQTALHCCHGKPSPCLTYRTGASFYSPRQASEHQPL
jgi:hypothetical protein